MILSWTTVDPPSLRTPPPYFAVFKKKPHDAGIQTAPSNCYPQNTLTPQDLLPEGEGSQIQDFNEGVPETGEGILKGVNFLDAGFHVGVNTVGQSLRNANLNLRAEPPNPRSQVSPWMNSTIDVDLARKPLADGDCNVIPGQIPA